MSNNPFSLGTYNVTPPTLSDGQTHQVELDVNANLKIASLPAGAAIIGQVEVTDGTNILGTSTHPVRTDPTGGTTQPVSGTVTATQATGTNLHVVVDSAPTTTVTGTVTANAGTGTFATQDAADGSTGSAVPTKATLVGASKSGSLAALLVDASGNLNVNVAAGGGSGGTSSTFGAAFPATGTAVGASDGTNMQGLQVESSTNKNLKVAVYNGATEVAIKAASTAAASTDPAIVVQLNPIQPNLTTALNVKDASDGTVAAGTAAANSSLAGGVCATAAATVTVGQQIALQVDQAGCLRVNAAGQTGSFKSQNINNTTTSTTTITVPAGKKWRFKSALMSFTPAASATNRNSIFIGTDAGGTAFAQAASPINMNAGTSTVNIAFGPSLSTSTVTISSGGTVGFPELSLGPGMTLIAFIVNYVAGDAFRTIINYEEYND